MIIVFKEGKQMNFVSVCALEIMILDKVERLGIIFELNNDIYEIEGKGYTMIVEKSLSLGSYE